MSRDLVVLGTASQAPTRTRNHNGYLLRWDDLGILFDPGEGTQRQLLHAGVRSSQITHIAVTHEHGDHTLGLPGVLQRMALDQRRDPVVLLHPAPAGPVIDRLLGVELFESPVDVRRLPLPADGESTVDLGRGRTLRAVPLDHRVPTLGYRFDEPAGRRMDPVRLLANRLAGPVVGRLQREAAVEVDGRVVRLEDVSDPVAGRAVAVVMDTRRCPAIARLLAGCDLALLEATYRDGEEDLALRWGHLTATQAAAEAAAAGVRLLVLTHYSQRHGDEADFAAEAARHHDDVLAARDLDVIAIPSRRSVAPSEDVARTSGSTPPSAARRDGPSGRP
jgi:ribonuclease Z